MGTREVAAIALVLLSLLSSQLFAVPLNVVEKTKTIPCGSFINGNLTLRADLFCQNSSLVLNASGITLDCAGHTITTSFSSSGSNFTSYGLFIQDKANLTVKNCIISRFGYGIYLENVTASRFYNNSFNNTVNAYETSSSLGNQWDYGGIGNSWSDFPQNPGYPENYMVSGPGDGIDHFPPGAVHHLSCGNLTTPGATYNLTESVSSNASTCFSIQVQNVTLDCGGYGISGSNSPGTYGVYSSQPGTVVRNCAISGFETGIFSSGGRSAILGSNISAAVSGIAVHGANSIAGGNGVSSSNRSIAISGSGISCENNTVASGSASIFGTSHALRNNHFNVAVELCDLQGSIIANNTIISASSGIAQASENCSLANNLLYSNKITANSGAAIRFISPSAQNNTLYWNNITSAAGVYVNDSSGMNNYNTTLGNHGEGNIYANVLNGSVPITGTIASLYGAGLYVGSSGGGYPYSTATSQGKFICAGNCADYAPLTPAQQQPPVLCGDTISQSITLSNDINCGVDQWVVLNVVADNITLDCAGHTITGSPGIDDWGINIIGRSGVTIRNCHFQNLNFPIYHEDGSCNIIVNNLFNGTRHGPILRKGGFNHIVNNTILSAELDGIGVVGYLNDGIPSINNIVSNNTLLHCGSDYASVELSYAHNTLVEGNYIVGTGQYDNSIIMLSAFSINNTISHNRGMGGDYGFWVAWGSGNNTIVGNYISNSSYVGIYIDSETQWNRMSNNTVLSSAQNNAYQEPTAELNDWEIGGFGNYWGDHNCVDLLAPIGICDNPYNFPGDTDYSPLANPTWQIGRDDLRIGRAADVSAKPDARKPHLKSERH